MYGKMVCLLVLGAAMLLADGQALREAGRRERIVYGALAAPLLYLGLLFVTQWPWPNLDSLFDLLAAPAKRIVGGLNPAASS
ncbi:hypothetical protein J19TS2_33000 [Cohnella xylanilytica]|uniref:hypothetical protein n=1 Tax=Cohnella xylanilytica TaxID=557555 RepID=UPI001B1A3E4B|nr:hypothetical protein [Cohnella xylanilytica]GIO13745.1 hypothetical protein J19TS2_33000 [Cohnella xylanilytica]